jgi:exopolysaccharide biosynthesis polyprenyl glycosylphosphotransferase
MTQVSVSPLGRPVRELSATPRARIARHVRDEAGDRPEQQAWAVRDAAVAAAGAAVAVCGLVAVGTALDPRVALAIVVLWPLLLASQGSFVHRPLGEPTAGRAIRVLRAGGALGLLSWIGAPLLGAAAAPALMLPTTGVVTATGLVVAARRRRCAARVMLVGHAEDIDLVAGELARSSSAEVVGGCVPSGIVRRGSFPVRAGVDSAVDRATRAGADTLVVLPCPDIPPALVRRLQWQAAAVGMGTYVGTGLLDVASFRMSLATGPGPNLLHVRPSASTGTRRLVKAACERTLALVALCLLAPLLALVALLVRLDSPGPALFRQERVGRNGTSFTMYKFRTMSCAAEAERDGLVDLNEGAGVLFKLRADPRVTRVGRVLRRYSLDELPQLWNIMNGDMALVGPRPALPDEVARYESDPRRRLAVKPGLTGLWQVSGRSDLDWEQAVRLDLRYVDNWSLRLDAWILFRTFRAVLEHRGAY